MDGGDSDKFMFAIDRGGTFTDVWARCPGGKEVVLKLLSEDPRHYRDAPTEAIRRILEQETGEELPRGSPVRTERIAWIRMGTTVATNALLERRGQRCALAVTAGFRDLLHIGNQSRPNIFDLKVECPEVLYEEVVEVKERLLPVLEGTHDHPHVPQVRGSTGEALLLLQALDEAQVRADLARVAAKGITSLAVLLLHSYSYREHEQRVASIAREVGFSHVSLSSSVSAMLRAVPRGYTASSDAYLTPVIRDYLEGFKKGFERELQGVRVSFMQSDGGLTRMDKFIGSRAILSGPAGGVVGYAATSYQRLATAPPEGASSPGKDVSRDVALAPVIGFDMGGTSTDVSRYAGAFEHVFESSIAGITLQSPQLDINTVAAGGGSRLFFQSGLFVVGPESAGANPGPVCYKKGGPLAVTDANLLLGRLLPDHFPKIFGPTEDQPLDAEATAKAFEELTAQVNAFEAARGGRRLTPQQVALGFIRVANEAMCRPIRALTQAKGHDTSRHVLAVFGGAGGQHACAVARSLGMRRVVLHRYAGVLSAYGLALADTVHELQEPCAKSYVPGNFEHLRERLAALEQRCRRALQDEGFPPAAVRVEAYLHLRYSGTDCALMCAPAPAPSRAPSADETSPPTRRSSRPSSRRSSSRRSGRKRQAPAEEEEEEGDGVAGYGCFKLSFLERYKREFGFTLSGRTILVDDVRVRGVAASGVRCQHSVEAATGPPQPIKVCPVYLEGGEQPTPVYDLSHLRAGHTLPGPALVLDRLSTILIEPDCLARVTAGGDLLVEVGTEAANNNNKLATDMEPVQLSIFCHRFMSLAEQMGRVLQRTSISTNIKERLDFSCAVFGPDGGLVSNAPHIPVHLGAMQETVQYQLRELGEDLHSGDVLLSNHPSAGGSHLPDLTVITPVFHPDKEKPIFYVASRGHHADIGGITPGSMPPHSTSIQEEGAVFFSFKLVKKGVFQEAELVKALMAPGKIPGSSGTRNLSDNLSDLKAQIAANQKGIQLVEELIQQYGLDVVQAYMGHIQTSAEMAVRDLLKEVARRYGGGAGRAELGAVEYMDDGTPIAVSISIDAADGSAVIDFEGTGPEVWGNCNAPRAVTVSAVIYCLRCMVGRDTPLNQGCLAPVTIKLPQGCILQPSVDAAVVGGNVQTSQRVVDVLLKAFGACAASQGCMNNVTFGDASVGYYETVAGGAGAGPGWHGRSGVHSHMTNTRITDPEVLETRYPVFLKTFTLNPNTGGNGKYRGGDGVVRELVFRRPLTLSLLTERRVFPPYGLGGGEAGRKGQNLLVRKDGRTVRLPSKSSVQVEPGDMFRLETPGGGGYGRADDASDEAASAPPAKRLEAALKGSVHDFTQAQLTA